MSALYQVVVQLPAHGGITGPLCYRSELPLSPGALVLVPLGTRMTLGVVWGPDADTTLAESSERIRSISHQVQDFEPLGDAWRQLLQFAAGYYQRSIGEMVIGALPAALRKRDAAQLDRALRSPRPRMGKPRRATKAALGLAANTEPTPALLAARLDLPVLTEEQAAVLTAIHAQPGPFLLFGSTGSGKTEVYLRCIQRLMEQDGSGQALIMVPEINLTPQLEARIRDRFEPLLGPQAVVCLHSGLTPPQRLKSWLAAHRGARIVLGTRMAVFASLPALRLIVVDEEHDPSYKQQEGARHSARDLAIYRGRQQGAKVLLASATPSLESWHHSRPAAEGGRYLRLAMPARIGAAAPPRVLLVDMKRHPKGTVLAQPLLAAIGERINRGEQCLVLLNRRGYAPVLQCLECGWKSECPHCSAYRVFHKIDRSLRCHHCSLTSPVPRHCPACGNPDIHAVGRGTERLEEQITEQLQGLRRPDGGPVRIMRIDADSTRLRGALEASLATVHEGEVDLVVGTQMVAKGHDFRRVTLVAAVNPDSALFSSDFRAPERLFALLLQAAGRAGRDAARPGGSEMWVQTFHPRHPLFLALRANDFPAFAARQLLEREQAGLPPFSHQALLRAEARSQESAQAYLARAGTLARSLPDADQVIVYPPIPLSVQRVAGVERAHMLLESLSRAALQRFLAQWQPLLHQARQEPASRGLIRWAVDVDPLAI